MIKFSIRLHDLDCALEVTKEIHDRFGDEVEIAFHDSAAAAVMHGSKCVAKKKDSRLETGASSQPGRFDI